MEGYKEEILLFDNDYYPVTENKSVYVDPFCNSVAFINIGTTVAFINGIVPLNPGVPGTNNGESYVFGGNKGEIFKGRIDISFTGGAGSLLVIQKIYSALTRAKLNL